MAIASLILSLCGVITCGITGLVGMILGIVALKDTAEPNVGGRGLAIAGIIIGPVLMLMVSLPIIAAIAIPSLIAGLDRGGQEANAIGTLSATRSAQQMYQSKYNTYGTFGDLYAARYLQEQSFNVGAGTAYKYGYTFMVTVDSSAQWDCLGMPDDPEERYVKVDETGTFSTSEDNGTTWTPLGE